MIRPSLSTTTKSVSPFEAALFLVLLTAFATLLPWWGMIVPAFAFGFLKEPARFRYWFVGVFASAVWFAPALIQDMRSGFRISSRVADVLRFGGMGWLAPAGVYGITLLTAFLLPIFAAIIGSSLRAACRQGAAYLSPAEEKQAG